MGTAGEDGAAARRRTSRRFPVLAAALLVLLALATCSDDDNESAAPAQELAAHEKVLGEMPVPVGNPQTEEKVELGKMLFFDPRLSGDNKMSCATCHNPELGFSDGLPRANGAQGELGRNSPTIWNAAYVDFPFWDGRTASLEEQAGKPIVADVEMNQKVPELIEELEAVPEYRERFRKVFGTDTISFTDVTRAIAAFERTVLTFNSPFDRFEAGDESAMSTEARQGMELFFGKAACASCHTKPLFTDNRFHVIGVPQVGPKAAVEEPARSENEAQDLEPTGRRVLGDLGRFEVTGDLRDNGAFRTPTLRNVELSGPYMHDGAFKTLEEVVTFYNEGGGDVENRSKLVFPLNLNDQEQKALVAFLKALTDTSSTKITPPSLP